MEKKKTETNKQTKEVMKEQRRKIKEGTKGQTKER